MKHAIVLLWVLLTLLYSGTAGAGELRFEHVMTENGVSVAETNAVAQDQQGFIWVGGSNGLARYNGQEFELFLHDPQNINSLSGNYVWDILVDHRGDVWIATTAGLNRFNSVKGTFERFLRSTANPASIVSNDIYTLYEDRENRIWVGTRQGLDRFDESTRGFRHFRHSDSDPKTISDNSITSIFQDSQGDIWVGTQQGLNKFNPVDQSFDLFEFDGGGDFYDETVSVRDLVEDKQQNFWVGTDQGLFRFNQQTGQAEHYINRLNDPLSLSDNRVWNLMLDNQENLWVATDRGGLNKFIFQDNNFQRYSHNPLNPSSLGSNQVREIFQDSSDDYWVALFPSGVDYANHTAASFSIYRQDISRNDALDNDVISAVASGPDGNVWVGSEGGLYLFDTKKENFQKFKHNPRDKNSLGAGAVLSITEDHRGRYWFGTWSGGLNLYLPKSNSFKRFMPDPNDGNSVSSSYIWSLLGDSKGDIWIGTEAGALDRYNPKTNTFIHFKPNPNDPQKLSGGFIRSIVEDSRGVIWIATINGLNRFNSSDFTFTRFQHKPTDDSSLPHNNIASIFEDDQQRFWIGTEGGGLALMDRQQGTFTTYGVKQGLSNNSVMGISQDNQGSIWLNTLRGLNRFDPEKEVFSTFTEVNGLAGSIMNRPAIYFDPSGLMMVGSTKGLTRFRPENIQGNLHVPPVVLTSFKVFNREVKVYPNSRLHKHIQYMDEVVLDYHETMFSFGFTALNFRNSGANQYLYFLEGFDNQWISAEHGQNATYTSLGPGHYRFKVKGSNNNGVWNEEGHSIGVVILPPPWRTWWAYSLYTLLFFGLIYAFVHSQRRKFEFEKQKVAQLRAIDKVKDEFLANTSHELRTPLNGIIGLTESLVDDPKAEMSEQVRAYLRMVAGSGRRLSNLINDILDFSKLKNNGIELKVAPTDLKSICDSVCVMIQPLASKKSLSLLNLVADNLPPVMADEDRLQQVLYNLIGNAIKFTGTGSVKILTRVENDEIAIYIEDTGVGIPEKDLASIFESFTQGRGDAAREYEGTGLGLAVAKNLIELHGGKVTVESEVNKGSTFCFTLKISDVPAVRHKVNEHIGLATRINSIVGDMEESEGELVITESPNRDQYKFHILVVDDDEINREVLMSQLSLHDYRISQAVNGQEAVEAVRGDDSIDMVLLDVMMPRMTGYQAAEQIRAIKPVHELPIIFITAKHLASDLVAGFVAGGNDFLIKPISKNELLSRTKTHLLLLDVTRNLENIVEERTEILRKTQHSLEVVDSIVHMINREDSLEGLARILLREASVLLGNTDVGALWLLNDQGRSFELVATDGNEKLFNLFPGHISRRYLFSPNNTSQLHTGVQLVQAKDITFIANLSDSIENVLVMAIEADNVMTGLLLFANKKGAQFTADDVAMLSRIETHAVSAVSKAKMLTVLKQQNEKLEKISYTDQLTKLNNRRHLVRYLQGDLALCNRRYQVTEGDQCYPSDGDLLFLMMDIDFFKSVNDSYGHNAGDIILKEFADKLRSVFRESDHLIRWGGEEFLVVIRFSERDLALSLVERFRKEIEDTEFDIGNGVILKKTCSIGYSTYPFYQNAPQLFTWEQVVEIADKCLYIAKTNQRNAWVGVSGNSISEAVLDFPSVISKFKEHVNNGHLILKSSIGNIDEIDW